MNTRRYDLDWLRIGAFALLILYHVGMFYVTWDWHVKSHRAGPAIEPLMRLVNPWRLTLLFVISGAATRFMADKARPLALLRSRMARLLPPLILAVLVIVPPQSYLEVVEALGRQAAGSPWSFWLKYMTASGHWCDADGCLMTPTYNHMWFVVYLAAYTLVLVALLPLLRRLPPGLDRLIAGPWLIVTPWIFLTAIRLALRPRFGETDLIYDDWYQHAAFFSAFLFGFAIARQEAVFETAMRLRWPALALALAGYWLALAPLPIFDHGPAVWRTFGRSGPHELQAWAAIITAFGFAWRHLRGVDGPARRYLTEAIFPFYLVHQTAIIIVAHYLDPLDWPVAIEAAAIVAATLAACVATLEIGRRLKLLRPWIGLAPI